MMREAGGPAWTWVALVGCLIAFFGILGWSFRDDLKAADAARHAADRTEHVAADVERLTRTLAGEYEQFGTRWEAITDRIDASLAASQSDVVRLRQDLTRLRAVLSAMVDQAADSPERRRWQRDLRMVRPGP